MAIDPLAKISVRYNSNLTVSVGTENIDPNRAQSLMKGLVSYNFFRTMNLAKEVTLIARRGVLTAERVTTVFNAFAKLIEAKNYLKVQRPQGPIEEEEKDWMLTKLAAKRRQEKEEELSTAQREFDSAKLQTEIEVVFPD